MGEQRRRTTIVGVAAAGIALGAAFGPPLAGAAVEKVQEVLVLNDEDSEAIATRAVGTTQVAVTGTPQVELTGTPTVRVASSSSEPIVVQEKAPTSTPVAENLLWRFNNDLLANTAYEVPADKSLTIEHVSGEDGGHAVALHWVSVIATSGGRSARHHLLVNEQGAQREAFSQSLKIVADPGTTVLFSIGVDGTIGSGTSAHFMHGAFAGTLTTVSP